ncbi:MAG: hypothetical protein ACYC64_05725 [Armatimonadota bacterium]
MKRVKLVPVRAAALICGCVVLATVTGCGGGGGGGTTLGADITPPTISNTNAVLPAGFTFEGGSVTIHADVTDDVGVATVQAAVSKGGLLVQEVTLTRASGNTYQAVVNAPANTSSVAVACTVVVGASDAAGNASARSTFSFNVPSASGAPPLPPPGL